MMQATNVDNQPKSVLVVGLGISGCSVCELLLERGCRVIGTDMKHREQFGRELDVLENAGCQLRLGGHDREDFVNVDQIVISPGVPLNIDPLREARARGIEIIGELDWAWRQVELPVVAVTGTNGKTTTTSLIGEMIRASGRRVFVGGNIGTPLSRWIQSAEVVDFLALEISSFQLDSASHFAPDIAVLLNVTEDHLDRYDDFAAYAGSKLSIFSRQHKGQVAIVNVDDPICRVRLSEMPAQVLKFSRTDGSAHAVIEGRRIAVSIPGKMPFGLDVDRAALKGVHNQENILAAVLVGAVLDISPPVMQQVIEGYRGLPHRMEWVRTWRGIDFYDDSKATNVGAVVKALENFDRGVLLLLGGRDKLGSYAPLVAAMKKKVKGAFVFGEAAPRLLAEVEEGAPAYLFPGLEEALRGAVDRAAQGDVVLLSPACSSFDQYVSYAQRGDHFKRLVSGL